MLESYYGVNTDSKIRWKENASIIFMDEFYLKDDNNKKTYVTYCEDNDLDPEDTESKEEFVENYENETYCWHGLEGLIADHINDCECNHNVVFRHDYYILGVMPRIPENNKERDTMLTQENIKILLTKYLNPLLEEPVIIDWYDIYE